MSGGIQTPNEQTPPNANSPEVKSGAMDRTSEERQDDSDLLGLDGLNIEDSGGGGGGGGGARRNGKPVERQQVDLMD